MGYKRKITSDVKFILKRIKDTSLMIPGTTYHLRKILKQEGNTIIDEVHDIVLKEIKDDFLIEQETDKEFSAKEFEIFIRK